MKKRITTIFILVIALLSVFSLASCGSKEDSEEKPEPSSDYKAVEVYLKGDYGTRGISVPSEEVDGYDYTQYFAINADGNLLEVKPEYIDATKVVAKEGSYRVTCTFQNASAELVVYVTSRIKITTPLGPVENCRDEDWDEFKTRIKSRFKIVDYRNSAKGEIVKVTDDMVDYSEVEKKTGIYKVYCTYGDVTKSLTVNMTEVRYSITTKQPEITLNVSRVEKTNFADYFKASREGKDYAVTADMLESNVKSEPGDYTVVCKKNNFSATLTVHVTDAHEVEIGKAYDVLRLTKDEVATHDFTKDFWIYVDKTAVPVTADMVDASALSGTLAENENYTVTLTYDNAGTDVTKDLIVGIVPAGDVIVNARNAETYPNGEYIDLTALFTITDNGKNIPVTSDMVSGSVNYTEAGDNVITLTYKGVQYNATVTVRTGAIVKPAKGDRITVKAGTDKNAYDFASDFIVIINGKRYRDILQYIDTSAVDFSTKGEYPVEINVLYNSGSVSATGAVKFTEVKATITYVVQDKEYSGSVKESRVTVKQGESYNVFRNLNVVINGYEQQFTENPDQIGGLTCYAEIVEGKNIDFNVPGVYNVKINVFVDGANSEYFTLSYVLIVNSDVIITAAPGSAIVRGSVYLPDLFTITDGDEEVSVTVDMITGVVDFFTPGVYTVTVTYKDFSESATVTIFDDKFIGTYKTNLKTIAQKGFEDDDGYVDVGVESKPIGDLVIDENMNITVHGIAATDVKGIDENTFTFNLKGNKHTMYFDDGIAVIVPENSLRMKYTDDNRSLVYYNTNVWSVSGRGTFTLNSKSAHVLAVDYAGYSIDSARITRVGETASRRFALKTELTEHSGSDFYYKVTWGFIEFDDGFSHGTTDIGKTFGATFDGEHLRFSITSPTEGKIDTQYVDTSYYGKTFTGGIDGIAYTLGFSANGSMTLKKGTETVVNLLANTISTMKYGKYDYSDRSFTVYGSKVRSSGSSGYDYSCDFAQIKYNNEEFIPFAYKFYLDLNNNTFTYVQKDDVFGLYKNGNQYMFFDGYGNGLICFDMSSYEVTALKYALTNSDIAVTYVNMKGSFKYGQTADFYIDVWKNIVTAKRNDGGIDVGKAFESVYIASGAIVRVGDLRLVSSVKADGTIDQAATKAELLSRFTIITKDGEMSDADKAKAVNIKKVSVRKEGFYEITVTLTVNGTNVTNYYSVQVILPKYESTNPFVGSFNGVIPEIAAEFAMDASGMVTLTQAGTEYTGLATLADDAFTCFAYSSTGRKLVVKGSVYSDHVIQIVATGAENVNAFFTKGIATYAGTKGYVVRAVKTTDGTEFFVSATKEAMGTKAIAYNYVGSAAPSLAVGEVISLTVNDVETVLRVDEPGNYNSGITLATGPLGTYTSGENTIAFDGFGNATYNGVAGTYMVIDDRSVVFKYASGENSGLIARIDTTADGTFTDAGSPLSLADIKGNYYAELSYYGDSDMYTDVVTFSFNADGSATVSYTIDASNNETMNGKPDYADAVAAVGSVTLKGDVLTVTATKGSATYTFVFTVTNPIEPTVLELTSAPDLSDYEGPELSAGKTFEK